ncbi:hypothetical protein PInf_005521 [Phytophthora infestans]|nr:hypothetical protein PInf_005521 [Phytophthora infestans]
MRLAEEQAMECRGPSAEGSFQMKFAADREAPVETDPVLQLVNSPVADMFTNGEPDESSLVPVFGRRSFVDDICFGGEDFDSCLATLDRLLARFAQCRISISFTKSIFCQPKVDFLSHKISPEGIRDYELVMSFDGSAKPEKYGGYGSCSWVLWGLPEWKIVIAANAYLSATTVNEAEYTGMISDVKAAIAHGVEDLVIVGDSKLAIQQSLGVIACRKETLLALLNIHKELAAKFRSVKYLHDLRENNAAADSLATEALESKVSRVILAETRKSELVSLNRIQEMVYEPDEDSVDVSSRGAERQVHVLSGSESSKWKTFENFVVDYSSPECDYNNMAVMPRRQTKAKKRVRFADEHSEGVSKAQKQHNERRETSNEDSIGEDLPDHPHKTVPAAFPDAEDVDPVAIQRERRRRIMVAQAEEQK